MLLHFQAVMSSRASMNNRSCNHLAHSWHYLALRHPHKRDEAHPSFRQVSRAPRDCCFSLLVMASLPGLARRVTPARNAWRAGSIRLSSSYTPTHPRVGSLEAMDGNTAAVHVAYAMSETAFIYPISPATSMGDDGRMELRWSSQRLRPTRSRDNHAE